MEDDTKTLDDGASLSDVRTELLSIQAQNRRLELEIGKLQGKLRLARSLGHSTPVPPLAYHNPSKASLSNLRQTLLRTLLFLQCPSTSPSTDTRTWYYIDGSERRHGPFTTFQMRAWQKHFHPRQHVSCTPLGSYVPFGDVFDTDLSISLRDLQLCRFLLLEILKPQ